MRIYPYSSKIRKLLDNPPAPGENRHHWLFTVQAGLIRQGFRPEDVEKHVLGLCKAFKWDDRIAEVHKNTEAILSESEPPEERDAPIAWPEINHDARRQRSGNPKMFDFADSGLIAADVLPHLYRDYEWICAAPDRYNANTYRLIEILKIADQFEFIVANPMRSEYGKTGAGKRSARTKDNACTESTRRYAVIEFDTNDEPDDQIAVLSSLHTPDTPLMMAVWSGNKSIHGWYSLAGLNKQQKRNFYWLARYLGADNALWGTSWLVRMPGGKRESGERQTILYFEPEHITQGSMV